MRKNVAYLGIPGAYSHQAAIAFNGGDATLLGYQSFAEVFGAVSQGYANVGIVPIENTLAGSIYENYDLIDKHRSTVTGEQYLRIEHSLLVAPELGGVALAEVKKTLVKVYSHPKALEQCNTFLAENPHIEPVAWSDTASAAQFVSETGDPTVAAIASLMAGEVYGLQTAVSNLENNRQNYTRFIAFTRHDETIEKAVQNANKCSVVLYLPHTSGTLQKALQVLADTACNLTKIESRPLIGKPFEYLFYLDFGFAESSIPVDQVIKSLEKYSGTCTMLGMYKSNIW